MGKAHSFDRVLVSAALAFSGSRLLNRELGMLAFNERVLVQADDPGLPLLERLRYLTIVSNNLDELFEVRVADLKELMRVDPMTPLDSGPVSEALSAVAGQARQLVARQYALLNEVLLPALAAEGLRILMSTRLLKPTDASGDATWLVLRCCRLPLRITYKDKTS